MADPVMTNPQLIYSTRNVKDCIIGFFSIQFLLENASSLASSSNPTKVIGFETEDCLEIIGSCNGLLCLLDILFNFVQLWNPCMGLKFEWLEIEPRGVCVMHYGFGYDHMHDKYKLLLFVQKRPSKPKIHEVLTFGANNSWSTLPDFPFIHERCKGEFVSDTLNWLHKEFGSDNSRAIVFFDLGRKAFGNLSLPFMNDENECEPVMHVARECLCVCIDHQKSHFDVWMTKKYRVKESWTRLIVISHVALTRYEPKYPLDFCTSMRMISSNGMTKFPMSERAAPRGSHVYHESLVSSSHLDLETGVFVWD
ncbi:hypothetical protein PIB30_000864 [Stylosanthes scabra]|uniref:F-box associated beta-propeller type 1 domain-containing protein n=1 Tax=Stylosanthes scabra TaxID=79078 RepID=A0ABU6R2C7_9FABA|nr:hypothetical protein [Stylosanthes scabra]